jgi:hypothetical protein
LVTGRLCSAACSSIYSLELKRHIDETCIYRGESSISKNPYDNNTEAKATWHVDQQNSALTITSTIHQMHFTLGPSTCSPSRMGEHYGVGKTPGSSGRGSRVQHCQIQIAPMTQGLAIGSNQPRDISIHTLAPNRSHSQDTLSSVTQHRQCPSARFSSSAIQLHYQLDAGRISSTVHLSPLTPPLSAHLGNHRLLRLRHIQLKFNFRLPH